MHGCRFVGQGKGGRGSPGVAGCGYESCYSQQQHAHPCAVTNVSSMDAKVDGMA
jgi:hypothetical protein